MKTYLTIAFIGNLIDTAATLYLTSLGYIEANPVMRPLLQYPVAFVATKLCAMTAVLWWIWRRRGDRLASAAAWFAAVVNGAIAVYYAVFLAAIV